MPKFYVVRKGRQTGIFTTWPECQEQVTGFSGAEYKSFSTRVEAEAWLGGYSTYKKPPSAPPAMPCSKNVVDAYMQSQRKKLYVDEDKFAKAMVLPPTTKTYQGVPLPQSNDQTIFYTDGSCQNERGGWAYIIVKNGEIIHERSGEMPDYPTTNNRAELMAILKLLEENPGDLFIRPDSDYAIKCVSVWWKSWKRRGWKKSDGATPENLDLIKEIIRLQEGRNITYDHVYGHSGNKYNDRCDKLAEAAYQQ